MPEKERVLVERLIAGMQAVIEALSPKDSQRVIYAIRAVDQQIAEQIEAPPNKTN
jgi:hypothetical protein